MVTAVCIYKNVVNAFFFHLTVLKSIVFNFLAMLSTFCMKFTSTKLMSACKTLTFILGHLKTIKFPFGTNGKLMVLGVPILGIF